MLPSAYSTSSLRIPDNAIYSHVSSFSASNISFTKSIQANYFKNSIQNLKSSAFQPLNFFSSNFLKKNKFASNGLTFELNNPNESSNPIKESSQSKSNQSKSNKSNEKTVIHFPAEAVPTDSGYLAVDYEKHSSLFYVFYEALNPERSLAETPLLIWLNGGPGCSSLIGCFYELGPYLISGIDLKLRKNEYAWNRRYGVVFIDNPIGTGFSIAENDKKVPKNQDEVTDHFLHALSALYLHHPTFQTRPLILAGESYAGKYLPNITQRLLNGIMDSGRKMHNIPIKLLGMAIGNSLVHPRSQVLMHADVSHSLGLLDKEQSLQVDKKARRVVELIDKEEWVQAHKERTELCDWIELTAGIPTLLDIRRNAKYHATEYGQEYLSLFLNDLNVKKILKSNPEINWMSCNPKIRALMAQDTMKSSKDKLESILSLSLPILLFQGMYDAKDGPASCESWMRMLSWQHDMDFWSSKRNVWKVNGQHAGYYRTYANLTHVVLTNAGHQVPVDQPYNSLLMIETWIENLMKRGQFFT